MPRFRDIEPYTRDGNWQAHFSLDSVTRNINDWVKEHDLKINPDFQRGHVWEEDKQVAFVEHILRNGVGSNVIRFNHPDWMNFRQMDGMVLVDGLQRLTAVMRFMNNEIPAFGYLLNEYDDKPNWSRCNLIFMVNDLKTRKEVLQWYLEINTGGVVHTEEEIDKVKRLLEEEENNA